MLFACPLRANEPKPTGSADRSLREAAQQAIPWRQLSAKDRQALSRVVGDATLYRQLPTRIIDCDEDLFAYLVDHPEVVVDCWNVMGVSRLSLEPIGPGRYRASDSAGAQGQVRVLHRSGGGERPLKMVLLAEGVYHTPPMPHPLRGSSALLLRAETVQEANGRSYITTRLDSFMRFDQAGTKLIAKTLRPLIFRTADHNFVETMRFLSLFNRTAETNPAGMERLAGNLRRTDPATQREFAQVCYETAERYSSRRRVSFAQPALLRR